MTSAASGSGWPETVKVPTPLLLSGADLHLDVQMLIALGAIVRASSMLEFHLRSLFCALEEGKYAAVTAAGQNPKWLIDGCRALVDRRAGVADGSRDDLKALLATAVKESEERNRYVHDVWSGGDDGPELMQSRRSDHTLKMRPVTLESMLETAEELKNCGVRINRWIVRTLGASAVTYEALLRWEDHLRTLSPEQLATVAQRQEGQQHRAAGGST